MKKRKKVAAILPDIASDVHVEYGSESAFNPFLISGSTPRSNNTSRIAPSEFSSLISLIKSGITRKSLGDLLEVTGLSLHEMAACMHLNERTLRNYAPDTHLDPEPSERAIEIGFLYEKGKDVFGSLEDFKLYMSSPVPALGMKAPKEFLDTSVGINFLMDELGRIQHGVFG
jgi:putative toxin-antitoxin system antitoxin component (TIGR02293 family)